MNQNYIAPEALDESVRGTCMGCKRLSISFDEKVSFYQGSCPHCGANPSAMPVQKPAAEPHQYVWNSGHTYIGSGSGTTLFRRFTTSTVNFQEVGNEEQNASAEGLS